MKQGLTTGGRPAPATSMPNSRSLPAIRRSLEGLAINDIGRHLLNPASSMPTIASNKDRLTRHGALTASNAAAVRYCSCPNSERQLTYVGVCIGSAKRSGGSVTTRDGSLRILLDTNILIAVESDGDPPHPNGDRASALYRSATALGHTLCLAAGVRDDLARHKDPLHRRRRERQLERYHVLNRIDLPKDFQRRAGYPPVISEQSQVDLSLLLALQRGAVQWLVTEDQRIIPHARALGLADRVFNLVDALDVLRRQQSQPVLVPSVEQIAGYELDPEDPIFDDFSPDYDIRTWLHDKVAREARPCMVMREAGAPLDAVVILNEEREQTWGLPGKVLKICTFKVADHARGLKRGEMLLWAIFQHARTNGYDSIFVEAFETEYELLDILKGFGFSDLGPTARHGEHAFGKRMNPPAGAAPLDPLEYNRTYGPEALQIDRLFLVPIVPQWHSQLFPVADTSGQLTLIGRLTDPGNAIRKAYLCHGKIDHLRAGDTLLFFRTRKDQMLNVVGVVEDTLRSADPTAVLEFTGRRTVYTPNEVEQMCRHGQVLAIRFRLDRVLDTPISMDELIARQVMKRSPQTVQQVKTQGAKQWLTDLLSG